jgi:diguanylate cyclase (GGDEF)-like protein
LTEQADQVTLWVYPAPINASYGARMKNRATLLLSADGRIIAILIAMIVLVAFGGVKFGQVVAADMLRADAQSTSSAWAATLVENANVTGMIAGMSPSDETRHLLANASQIGDTYQYMIWSGTGRLVFFSERNHSGLALTNLAEVRKDKISSVIRTGKASTEAHIGNPPESPAYFADSYIPIKLNGSIVGAFEVYLDQTADKALYERSFLLTESIIAFAVLLAGGLPGFMFYRKNMAHRAAQAEALFLAEHDSITVLPTRTRLEETATGTLAWTRRNKSHAAVLLVDLDRFKDVNDSFGHSAGDEVLRAFATRLSSAIREEDAVARLGGDEFVIVQAGIAQPGGASSLADRLVKILSKPYDIGGSQVVCAASIGVALAPTDGDEWDALLSCADVALYKAKAEGRNTVCFFEAGMDAAFRERRRLEADLRRALETDAFQLAYQPIFSFHDSVLLGFEALLRWPEDWSPQSPAAFIPVAEESGMIVPIGAWVLETACKTAAGWGSPLKVAVNLSPVQFRYGDIVSAVQHALRVSGLDPARLELEVTESLWIQSTDTVMNQLERLREMGIAIALDDFGTGYSSLTYLWKFPFDKVKIDRSFVMEMETNQKAAAIVSTIVALGRTLELTVVAEGVETQEQAKALDVAGCDQAQGYLFGRPLSTELANALANTDPVSTVETLESHSASEAEIKPVIFA